MDLKEWREEEIGGGNNPQIMSWHTQLGKTTLESLEEP